MGVKECIKLLHRPIKFMKLEKVSLNVKGPLIIIFL